MKMIDVLNLMAKGKIEKDTKLIVSDGFGEYEYKYKQQKGYRAFYNNFDKNSKVRIDDEFRLDEYFLNLEVELIQPMKKKYLIKLHIKGLLNIRNYLNYYNDGIKQWIELGNGLVQGFYQTRFTKQEMQDIKLVREFLEDMQGKYELIGVYDKEEVEDDAVD